MKKMKMKYTDITIKVHNQREAKLVDILNTQLENIVRYLDDEDMAEGLKQKQSRHWLVEDAAGLASAMFFMEMIPDPVTSYDIWEAISEK